MPLTLWHDPLGPDSHELLRGQSTEFLPNSESVQLQRRRVKYRGVKLPMYSSPQLPHHVQRHIHPLRVYKDFEDAGVVMGDPLTKASDTKKQASRF